MGIGRIPDTIWMLQAVNGDQSSFIGVHCEYAMVGSGGSAKENILRPVVLSLWVVTPKAI